MATLTVQNIAEAGLTPSFASAAGGGDAFAIDNQNRHFLYVKNGSGGAITVTITAQNSPNAERTFGQVTRAIIAVSVGAGSEEMIGPIPYAAFADASGLAQVTYSGVTSLTVAAIKLPDV